MGGGLGFYSYMWLRENGTPYYVEKGHAYRAYERRERRLGPPPPERIVVFLMDSEALAFESEVSLIQLFGRKNNGTGILRNLTDGGEGPSGLKHNDNSKALMRAWHLGKPLTEAHRRKIGDAVRGRTHSESAKAKLRTKEFGPEYRAKLSETARIREIAKRASGWRMSESTKAKISAALSGRPKPARSAEHCRKLRESKLGHVPWNKGMKGRA